MSTLVLAVGKGVPAGKCLLCTTNTEGSANRFRPVSLLGLQAGRDLVASGTGISFLGDPGTGEGPVSPGKLHIAPQLDPEELSFLWQLGIERADGVEPICVMDDATLLRLISSEATLSHDIAGPASGVSPIRVDVDAVAHILTGNHMLERTDDPLVNGDRILYRYSDGTSELNLIVDGAGGYRAYPDWFEADGVSGHLSELQGGQFKGAVTFEIEVSDHEEFEFSFGFDPRKPATLEMMDRFLCPDRAVASLVTLTSVAITDLGDDRFSIAIEAQGEDAKAFMHAIREHYRDLWHDNDPVILGFDKGVFEAFVGCNDTPSPDLCGYAIMTDNLGTKAAPAAPQAPIEPMEPETVLEF